MLDARKGKAREQRIQKWVDLVVQLEALGERHEEIERPVELAPMTVQCNFTVEDAMDMRGTGELPARQLQGPAPDERWTWGILDDCDLVGLAFFQAESSWRELAKWGSIEPRGNSLGLKPHGSAEPAARGDQ